LLLVGLVTLCVTVHAAARSSAAGLRVLPNGHVVVAAVVPSGSTVPVDGVLRGPDSEADVTAVAWPYEADGYVANTGDRLVAFTVSLTEPSSEGGPFSDQGPTLTLIVDDGPQQLDTTVISNSVGNATGDTGSGVESYVASVPNDTHDVELSMNDGGYTQALSLWTLERTTPAPSILYAGPNGSGLADQLGVTKDVPIRDAAGQSWPAVVVITSSTLSAFNPNSSNAPAPKGMAYLQLDMSAGPVLDSQGNNQAYWFSEMTPMPGSGITLTTNGRRFEAVRATPQDQSLNPNLTTDDGLVDATYYFVVPSDTTRGVVAIGPSKTVGTLYSDWTQSNPESLAIGGPVRFSVTFPASSKPPRQPTPRWVDGPVPSTGLPGSRSSGGGPLTVWIALLLFAATVVGVLLYRHLRAPSPTDEPLPPQPADVPSEPLEPVERRGAVLLIELIGPVRITPVGRQPTDFGRSLLCYLAVHDDRPRSVDDVQTALWPTGSTEADVSRKTFLNYVSEVRRVVGAEHLPDNVRRAGYRLRSTTSDWQEFRDLVAEAARRPVAERFEAQRRALELVRGVPLESELTRCFQWADSEGLRTEVTRAVVRVAIDLHANRVHAGDLDGAEWSLRQGLRCSPSELALWECLADVVQARADRGDLERFWRDAGAVLDRGAVAVLEARVQG
jgi:hypothetical protein